MDYDPMVMDQESSGPQVKITEVYFHVAIADLNDLETHAHYVIGWFPPRWFRIIQRRPLICELAPSNNSLRSPNDRHWSSTNRSQYVGSSRWIYRASTGSYPAKFQKLWRCYLYQRLRLWWQLRALQHYTYSSCEMYGRWNHEGLCTRFGCWSSAC